MIEVRHPSFPGNDPGGGLQTWTFEQWEELVREGRVPADALVRFPPVTGDAFVRASELQMYRSLRGDGARAFHAETGRAPVVTALLVGLQIRITWLALVPDVRRAVVEELTSFSPRVLEDGEVWRVLSMGILQVDPLHLTMNMMWLAYVGWNLERTVGRTHLLVLYGAAVLAGGTLSTFGSPWVPSLGASGGVFGLVAAAATFGLVRADLLGGRLSRGFGLVMVPYLLLMFWSGLQNEGVDNWCHLGGILSGGVLGLLVDPPTLERAPGWNRLVWGGVGVLSAAALVALFVAGPRVEPLADELVAHAHEAHTEVSTPGYRELAYDVPGGWQSGHDLAHHPAWCSPERARCFGVRADTRDHQATPDELAADVRADLLRDWPAAVIEAPQDLEVLGRPGLLVRARVEQAGVPILLEWRGTTRGEHTLEIAWQVEEARAARLAPLRDRLLERVAWSDPEVLATALHDAEHPTVRVNEALAAALAEVGEVDRAMALHEDILRGGTEDPKRLEALLETMRVGGDRVTERDRWYARVLAANPTSTVVAALADALDAAGEADTAKGLLTLTWDRAPGDRALSRARRARSLSRALTPEGLPWDLAVDPVTRKARTKAEIDARLAIPLDLDGIRAEGRELRARDDALRRSALDHLSAHDPAVLDDLVVLSTGELPGDLETARVEAATELVRAVDAMSAATGEHPEDEVPWAGAALVSAAARERPWLASLVPGVDAAPATSP